MNPLPTKDLLRCVDAQRLVVIGEESLVVPPSFFPGDLVWVSPDPCGVGWQVEAANVERHTLSASPKPPQRPLRLAGTASRKTQAGHSMRVGRSRHVLESLLLRRFTLAPAKLLRHTLRRQQRSVGEAL